MNEQHREKRKKSGVHASIPVRLKSEVRTLTWGVFSMVLSLSFVLFRPFIHTHIQRVEEE